MVFAHGGQQRLFVVEKRAEQDKKTKSPNEDAVNLHRWLVSFASGRTGIRSANTWPWMRKPPSTGPSKFSGQLPTIEPRKSPGMRPRCRGRYLGEEVLAADGRS